MLRNGGNEGFQLVKNVIFEFGPVSVVSAGITKTSQLAGVTKTVALADPIGIAPLFPGLSVANPVPPLFILRDGRQSPRDTGIWRLILAP